MNDPSAWISDIKLPEGLVTPVNVELVTLPDALYQMAPSMLQGKLSAQDLNDRLAALTSFVNNSLCDLTPGCQAAKPIPAFDIGVDPLRTPTILSVGAVMGNMIYVAGGSTSTKTSDSVNVLQQYDIQQGYWSTGPAMFNARMGAAGLVFNNALWVCGGTNSSMVLNSCEVYSPGVGWTMKANMNTSRYMHSMVEVGGQLYVLGGVQDSKTWLNSIELYTAGSGWMLLQAVMSEGVAGMAAVPFSGGAAVLLFGGSTTGGQHLGNISVFDGHSVTPYSPVMTLPMPRSEMAAINISATQFILVGGSIQNMDGSFTDTDTTIIFDAQANTLQAGPTAPWAVRDAVVAAVGDAALFMGGFADNAAATANITVLSF